MGRENIHAVAIGYSEQYLIWLKVILKLEKEFPNSEARLSLFECYIDKKLVYWSSLCARILNVYDIIKKRTKETSLNISSTCIPSTTIAGAGQHSFNTCLVRCTWYGWCMPTNQIPVQCLASVAAHCWFNAGQSSTTLAQQYVTKMSNTRWPAL